MSTFRLGGTPPPDRFFCALGRVSFEMERLNADLDILLQLLTQVNDVSILSVLVGGEGVKRRIEKCQGLLKVSDVFDDGDTSELLRILSSIGKLVERRNRYIHSAWESYDERSGEMRAIQRRGVRESSVSIENIEELADLFDDENDNMLAIVEKPFLDLF